MPASDLTRFVEVHGDHARALAEIRDGRKTTHWMWYVFPQIAGLGGSSVSRRYAIGDLDEAREFLTHPILGPDYVGIVGEVWHQVVERDVRIHALFGSPDDAKLVSSLTLFAGVARRLDEPMLATFVALADEILRVASAQGLGPCAVSEAFLDSA